MLWTGRRPLSSALSAQCRDPGRTRPGPGCSGSSPGQEKGRGQWPRAARFRNSCARNTGLEGPRRWPPASRRQVDRPFLRSLCPRPPYAGPHPPNQGRAQCPPLGGTGAGGGTWPCFPRGPRPPRVAPTMATSAVCGSGRAQSAGPVPGCLAAGPGLRRLPPAPTPGGKAAAPAPPAFALRAEGGKSPVGQTQSSSYFKRVCFSGLRPRLF